MNKKGESLYLPDDAAIQKARSEGYHKGWDDRRIFDEGIIQDALKDSRNYREFAQLLREKNYQMDGESE
jgi:hypothetical protein